MILLFNEPVEVYVDQTLTLREMISRGNYDDVDSDITEERFENVTYRWVKPEFMEFDFQAPYRPTPESGYWWRKKEDQSLNNPWLEASIAKLLAFGEAYSDLQRVVPIVALCPLSLTSTFGLRMVPCLDMSKAGRRLRLIHEREAYSGECVNLVYRSKKVPDSS